jgi:hypothetical protein
MLRRQLLRRIAIVWILGVVAVSLQPWRPQGESQSIVHPVSHMVLFGVAAAMLFALSENARQAWATALEIFCLAMAIETSQHLLYKNLFEWWDVRDDTIGVAAAWMLIRWTGIKSILLSENS